MIQEGGRPDVALDRLSKAFGSVVAVDDVSLQVGAGEFYSLLGPSGCGKTTTLRLIAGFERPDKGRISIGGRDVTAVPPHRRNVNTVFQNYALFPHLTVEENVAYGLKQKNVPKHELQERLTQALATVRLTELRTRKPRELSGGQQQRVALARALVNEPTVLLLDEPLAALDQKLRKAMQQELKKLQERVGISFLYVTHDQEEALTLSDRLAVMSDGRILQEGTPDQIYERPTSRFVADFIGQSNFFSGTVKRTDEGHVVVDASGLILRCSPTPWSRPGTSVLVSIRPEKIRPASPNAMTADDRVNVVTGRLARRTYLGDLVRYQVELPGGVELMVQRQNERGDPASAWVVGSDVDIAWDAESAALLPDEGDAIANEEDMRLVAESEMESP
ncbi:MAG TPA: ABC transporter ATP-binding protein, partial [Actinomycetota bacterium]|nr:ABC transporter ATP-binding protein [Actinomycetota bacterium]